MLLESGQTSVSLWIRHLFWTQESMVIWLSFWISPFLCKIKSQSPKTYQQFVRKIISQYVKWIFFVSSQWNEEKNLSLVSCWLCWIPFVLSFVFIHFSRFVRFFFKYFSFFSFFSFFRFFLLSSPFFEKNHLFQNKFSQFLATFFPTVF